MTVEAFKEKHGYEIEGIWMPRVTAITAAVSRSVFIPQMNKYAAWGTAVHEAIEGLIRGESVTVDERLTPSVQAFLDWRARNDVIVDNVDRDIECRVFDDEHWYAGTIDVAARINGKKGVIDIKTSTELREEHVLQTAAYANAYNRMRKKGEQAETRWILRVDQYEECIGCFAKKRNRTMKEIVAGGRASCNHQWASVKGEIELRELPDFQEDFAAFLSMKEFWEWRNRSLLKAISNYPKTFSQGSLFQERVSPEMRKKL